MSNKNREYEKQRENAKKFYEDKINDLTRKCDLYAKAITNLETENKELKRKVISLSKEANMIDNNPIIAQLSKMSSVLDILAKQTAGNILSYTDNTAESVPADLDMSNDQDIPVDLDMSDNVPIQEEFIPEVNTVPIQSNEQRVNLTSESGSSIDTSELIIEGNPMDYL